MQGEAPRPVVRRRPLPRSVLLTEAELREAVAGAMPGCTRISVVRTLTREIVVGFASDGTRPAAIASLSRVGDKKGNVVLVVGVGNLSSDNRITRVMTFSPQGWLKGAEAYEKNRDRFLEQFIGRRAASKMKGVDTISGATPVSKGIRNCVQSESAAIVEFHAQRGPMDDLAAAAVNLGGADAVAPSELGAASSSPPGPLSKGGEGERRQPGAVEQSPRPQHAEADAEADGGPDAEADTDPRGESHAKPDGEPDAEQDAEPAKEGTPEGVLARPRAVPPAPVATETPAAADGALAAAAWAEVGLLAAGVVIVAVGQFRRRRATAGERSP